MAYAHATTNKATVIKFILNLNEEEKNELKFKTCFLRRYSVSLNGVGMQFWHALNEHLQNFYFFLTDVQFRTDALL